jgi:hypothetical protein
MALIICLIGGMLMLGLGIGIDSELLKAFGLGMLGGQAFYCFASLATKVPPDDEETQGKD